MSTRRAGARTVRAAALLTLGLAVGACAPETKVVRYKPFLANLGPALQEGMTLKVNKEPVLNDARVSPVDPTAAPDNRIVIENEDGTKTLIARSPQHVMLHVERCLDEGEDDLLFEQMVAEQTKNYFRAQGKDPRSYIDQLRDDRRDIARLFARMPQGESSPTVMLRQFPERTWRIDVVGNYAKDLRFTRLWVQMERGQWKLLWID